MMNLRRPRYVNGDVSIRRPALGNPESYFRGLRECRLEREELAGEMRKDADASEWRGAQTKKNERRELIQRGPSIK